MKYLYQRNDNGLIIKFWQLENDIYIDLVSGMTINKNLLLHKVSEDITELIEVGDIVILEDEFGEHFCCMYDKSFTEAVKEDIKSGLKLKYILTKEEIKNNRFEV